MESTLVDLVNTNRSLVGDGDVNVNAAYIRLRSGVEKILGSVKDSSEVFGDIDDARLELELELELEVESLREGMDVDEESEGA
jgi:hypothetical protein